MKLHWQDLGGGQAAWGMGAIYILSVVGADKYRVAKQIMGPIDSVTLDYAARSTLLGGKYEAESCAADRRMTVSFGHIGGTIFHASSMDEAKAWAEKDCMKGE